MMESIEEILESVSKSYRKYARLLMKHLFRKAVPDRISWDKHGIMTIDGNVVKDLNIADLINDSMRERKTVKAAGRNQFARLLRVLNILSALMRNKRLLSTHSVVNNVKLRLRTSSISFISKVRVPRWEHKEGEKRKNYEQEIDEEVHWFFLVHEKQIPPYLCKREKIDYSVGKSWDNNEIWKIILRSVASYSAVDNLTLTIKPNFSRREVVRWLESQDAYTLHRS